MQSSIVSSTLCLSLLASLAVAAPNEPTQSGASQNSGVSQQGSGFFGTLLGTGGGTTPLTLTTAILATPKLA